MQRRRRRRAASLLLLATIEAGFNSYSLNSNSVGQDAGVTSTSWPCGYLQRPYLPPRALAPPFFCSFSSPASLSSHREAGRYVRWWTIGNRPSSIESTNRFLLRYFCRGFARGLFWTRVSTTSRVRIDNGRGASVSPCWMFDTHYVELTVSLVLHRVFILLSTFRLTQYNI